MRDQNVVSRNLVADLEGKVRDLQTRLSDVEEELGAAFSVEEMDAIREQLADRVVAAEAAREQLEWNLRLELARVREAEGCCLRAANEMHRAASSIANLLGEEQEPLLPVRVVSRKQRMHA